MSLRMVAIALAVAALIGLPAGAAALTGDDAILLKVGDRVRVDGADIGCQVERRGGEVVVDCHRAGHLRGTYGVFLGERTAKVARYRSDSVADVVFTARHRGAARRCGVTR